MEHSAGLAEAFRRQGEACAALGSPIYAELCEVAGADLEAGGPVAEVMATWGGVGDPMELALPLRLLGTAHRLALLGRAPDLAAHYPACGGSPGRGLGSTFLDLVRAEPGAVITDLGRPVQTNEVGRSAVLRPGLGEVAAEHPMPMRLLEIGSSAGLNLRLDHFSYRLGGVELGGDGPLLEPEWTGDDPPSVGLDITERAGCDPYAIDVTTADGAARAESFVWPDMTWRFERMAAAIDVARRVPARLDRRPAGEWLADHLHPTPATVTVLMHSVMWQYVPVDEQREIEALIEARGAGASGSAPIAHLWFEPRFLGTDHWRFEVGLRTWPGGEHRTLARAHPHGEWVRWAGPDDD
jgi:hypothetical protein